MILKKILLGVFAFLFCNMSFGQIRHNGPSLQDSKLGMGMGNFFKRIELQIGAANTTYKLNDYTWKIKDGEYKWVETGAIKKNYTVPKVQLNFNFPISQVDLHRVFGVAVGLGAEAQVPDLLYTMYSLPLYFYNRMGAEGSFDSRKNFSWGWGFGYEPYFFTYYLNKDISRLNGRALLFVEAGKFTGTMWKFKLEGNFYNKEIYSLPTTVTTDLHYFQQVAQFNRFPLKLSFVWLPFSGSWERNRWKM